MRKVSVNSIIFAFMTWTFGRIEII
eukprot:Gb_33100 [translate_table: standard]